MIEIREEPFTEQELTSMETAARNAIAHGYDHTDELRCVLEIRRLRQLVGGPAGRNVYSEEYVNELSAIGSKYMEKCDEQQREIARTQLDRDTWREQAERALKLADQYQAELIECRNILAETQEAGERDAKTVVLFYNQAKQLLDALETLYGDAVLDGPAQMISAKALHKAKDALKAARAGVK